MRPINRGTVPVDTNGNEIKFKKYSQARGELIKRLGQYCSYCEMRLPASLAVEHVQPKKPEGENENIVDREINWNNFLLACVNCNSTKGNEDVVLNDYFWPYTDNTFYFITYSEGGFVTPSNNLTPDQKEKADATIKLTGLDKTPLNDPKASDRRWLSRKEAWEIATRNKKRLSTSNSCQYRDTLVDLMKENGHWSIWMTVYRDDPDMLKRFIKALPGTRSEYFDENGSAIPFVQIGPQS